MVLVCCHLLSHLNNMDIDRSGHSHGLCVRGTGGVVEFGAEIGGCYCDGGGHVGGDNAASADASVPCASILADCMFGRLLWPNSSTLSLDNLHRASLRGCLPAAATTGTPRLVMIEFTACRAQAIAFTVKPVHGDMLTCADP